MNLLKEIALPLKGWVIAAARDDRNRYAHRQEKFDEPLDAPPGAIPPVGPTQRCRESGRQQPEVGVSWSKNAQLSTEPGANVDERLLNN